MTSTGINNWRFPDYTDSPDVPRDMKNLAADISAWVDTNPNLKGDKGDRGFSVLNGTTDPISTTGVDGDFYINTTSNSIFGPKVSGAWGSGTGIGGKSVLSGTVDPVTANGSNGDFYINVISSKIFGPKLNNTWPAGVNLVGPQGTPGATGAQGNPGAKGDAAATVIVQSTTTGAAGTQASVTNSGTSSDVKLNFVIPRGDKGDKGDPGADGARGADGIAGVSPNLNPIDTSIRLATATSNVYGVNSNWYPRFDNSVSIGQPIDTPNGVTTQRFWKTIYSNTGTINTSDSRLKKDVEASTLGLDFINRLRPVSYKFIEGSKTEDGISVPGERTHWGLIAQEVQSVIEDEGIDFGGWVLLDKNNSESEQALRYEEFIAPLIKAVQELTARVKFLEG
jgi:hypothetical protein